MNYRWLGVLAFVAALNSLAVQSPPVDLESELKALGTPGNKAPAGLSERLYVVQDRFSPLGQRHELSVGGSNHVNADGFMSSTSVDVAYRYYITNRWYVSGAGNVVFNSFSQGANRLMEQSVPVVPDVGVTLYRADVTVGYHLFYGKFRRNLDRVLYFDQYVALGPGWVVQDLGQGPAAVADIGIAMWIGRKASLRVGVKDYFFHEQRRLGNGFVHNLLGYFQAGYVFGG